MLGFGCSKTERQEIKADHRMEITEAKMSKETMYDDHQWNEGVKYADKAYHQLDDFDTKVFYDEPKRAKVHLEKALNDFSSSLTHFAKAEVGLDGQKAIKDVDAAVKQLNTCCDEIDKGNFDSAQSHYDKAGEYFTKAGAILG
jgi:hypothetical protein